MRKPGVAISAILALGLGVGLATTIFSFVYAASYRPLPVPEGNRILHLEMEDPSRGRRELAVGYHDFLDWSAHQSTFEGLAAFYRGTVNLSGQQRPERYFGGFLTTNAFDVLEVEPILGRGFLPEEDHVGAPDVAVTAHSVWQVRYGGDPEIVGRSVRVNGVPTTIIGVMPEGFAFPYWEDIWLPLRIDALTTERGSGPGLEVYGRLRDGVDLEEARAEFAGISARLADAYPATNKDLVAFVEPYTESYRADDTRLATTIFLGFGIAVLLIACFNVANLLLAQAVVQTRDMAVRVAMGASPGRVIAGVLEQALLLAAAGALGGIVLTATGLAFLDRWITSTATFPLPFWMELTVDTPILLFVLAAVCVSALASGLLPALRASKTDVHETLTDTSWGNSSLRVGRISRVLVLGQITGTAVLLILAGHLALQVANVRRAEYGYPTRNVLTARVGLFDGVFPTREERLSFYRELKLRLEDRPAVVAVALSTVLPGTEAGIRRAAIQGHDYPEATDVPTTRISFVTPGFFDAFETRVIEGRAFTDNDDDEGFPVAIVNSPFVERFFSGEDPVGRQIRLGWPEPEGPWRTVVGVVPDMGMDGAMQPDGDPEGVYLPVVQMDARFMSVAVITRGPPLAFVPTLRDEVAALQGDTPVYFVRTLHDAINTSLLDVVLVGSLLWALALAAFVLASLGLYGVTSFLAGQRTRELGVRVALGAKAGDVLRLIVRQGAWQILLGLAAGVLLSAGLTAVMESGGMETVPHSTPVTLAVCLVLALTGFFAVVVPAWKAAKVDPVDAFRAGT